MRKSNAANNIRESEIEEAFATNLFYLKNVLRLKDDFRLIARQMRLKQGEQRLDLLLMHGKDLCLVELKITKFFPIHIEQVKNYHVELAELQKNNQLVAGKIRTFLLVTDFDNQDTILCEAENIELIKYEPLETLKNYFQNLSSVSPFLKIKPNDLGVFNLGLMNRVLSQLQNGSSAKDVIASNSMLSEMSVYHHLKTAQEFGLVKQKDRNFFLTDFGENYSKDISLTNLVEEITQNQAEMLKQFVAKDPFYSSTVFGIYSIIETAFTLSRNSYPIEFDKLRQFFCVFSGKENEWQAKRTQTTATYTFLNFAIDLGLLGKIGKFVVITPAGFRFILMLQLHKSIEMIDSLNQT